MSAQAIPFAPARPFVEVEHLGADKATGRPVWWINLYEDEDEASGGGQANGVGDAESFDGAMAIAQEWGLPIHLHRSARGCHLTALAPAP